jgi:Protein of unknown function (DUF2842)
MGHCLQQDKRNIKANCRASVLPGVQPLGTQVFGAIRRSTMSVRLKKLIGTILLVTLVVIYALAATTFATYRLAQSSGWIHLAFFAFSGLLWILPAMGLISWMEKKPK